MNGIVSFSIQVMSALLIIYVILNSYELLINERLLITIRNSLETTKIHNHPGYNEYQQYLKSIGVAYLEEEVTLDYDVDIKVNAEGDVVTVIKEYDISGKLTTGGSSFLVTRILGVHCPMTDYFNGTYKSVCPAVLGTECSELIVLRQSVNYALYIHVMNPTKVVIERRDVCVYRAPRIEYVEKASLGRVVTWTRDAFNITNISHYYGVPLVLLNSNEICDLAVNNYEHIVMVGASHMRYSFDYFIESCFTTVLNLTRKHADFELGNVKYNNLLFGKNLNEIVEQEIKNNSKITDSLYIVQFGAHDLSKHDLEKAMNATVNSFIESIILLCTSNAKVLVTSTPPYPDIMQNLKYRVFRNNFTIAAFNYRVWMEIIQLKKLFKNLIYFDTFNAILPWQNYDTRCGCHYLCRIPDEGMIGHIGLQVFRLMMTEASQL